MKFLMQSYEFRLRDYAFGMSRIQIFVSMFLVVFWTFQPFFQLKSFLVMSLQSNCVLSDTLGKPIVGRYQTYQWDISHKNCVHTVQFLLVTPKILKMILFNQGPIILDEEIRSSTAEF